MENHRFIRIWRGSAPPTRVLGARDPPWPPQYVRTFTSLVSVTTRWVVPAVVAVVSLSRASLRLQAQGVSGGGTRGSPPHARSVPQEVVEVECPGEMGWGVPNTLGIVPSGCHHCPLAVPKILKQVGPGHLDTWGSSPRMSPLSPSPDDPEGQSRDI